MIRTKGGFRRSGLLLPMAAGLVVGVTVVMAQDGPKAPPNPDVGLSDADRAKIISQLKDRNAQWVQDFVDQARDPRTLPIVELPTYAAGATSVVEARAQSSVIIVGSVVSTTYHPDPDQLTESIATVRVDRVSKGSAPPMIEVLQIGGPAWSPTGGELQQLQGDP